MILRKVSDFPLSDVYLHNRINRAFFFFLRRWQFFSPFFLGWCVAEQKVAGLRDSRSFRESEFEGETVENSFLPPLQPQKLLSLFLILSGSDDFQENFLDSSFLFFGCVCNHIEDRIGFSS